MLVLKRPNNSKAKAYDHDSYTERFKHDSDAVGAYIYLFNKLAALFEEVEFKKFKQICALRGADCPQDFRKQMQEAKTLDDILEILEKPNYCNWLNIRLLKRIVRLTEIPEAQRLLDAYEKCLYSKKVSEVRPYFKSMYFDPKHLSKVEAKINKHAEMLVVSDVIRFCEMLESDLKFPEGSVIATDCDSGCFKLTCIIPVQCASHAYRMARKNIYKFRKFHIQYLQIEPFQKLYALNYHKLPSDPAAVVLLSSAKSLPFCDFISEYYTYLEAHMDADSVSHIMQCEHLITDDDYEAITTAPNDIKMNCLLLQYVKLMDVKMLLKFCDLLKSIETQKSIGETLEISLKRRSELGGLCKFINERPLIKGKWTSSLEPSHIHLQFFNLVDKILLLLSTADKICFNFADKCRSLMASDTHNIPLFADPFLSKLIECKSIFLLKILLLPFLSWLDHSVLQELTSHSDNDSVTDLLTQFDSLIDTDKPITAYPIPTLSELMIPFDDNFTIVATKAACNFEKRSLNTITHIKGRLMRLWKITEHAIQLIAICTKLNYLYWIVPQCIVSVIMNSVHNSKIQYKLWESGITMTTILPNLFIDDHDINTQQFTGGPFSVLSSQNDTESPLYNKVISVHATEMVKQSSLINEIFSQHHRLKSELKHSMARNDDMETYLKLKLPTLENENKALKTKFQKTKEKNFELERNFTLLQEENEKLMIILQSQKISDEEVKQYIEKSTEESYQTESLTESLTERVKSECEVAAANLSDSETSLKLKTPLFETKLKTLTDGYQKLKQKNSELEGTIMLLQNENKALLTQKQNINEELLTEKENKELMTQKQNEEILTKTVHEERLLTQSIEKEKEELLTQKQYPKLEDLKLACCSFLENSMDPTNCLGIMYFADTHGCPELIKRATEFTCLNFFDVMKSEEFLQLSYEHIRVLLTSNSLHVNSEQNAFDAYLNWIKHDIEKRTSYVMPLLDTIRIPYVDDDYLKEKLENERLIRDNKQCYQLLRGYLMGRSSCQGSYQIKPRTPKETIYVVGGRNRAKCLNSAEKYDYIKNKWIELPSMDQVRTAVGLGSLDGRLYAVGGECEATGHEGTLYLKSVECFDPRTNCWSRIPDMQFPRSFAAVSSFNGCLYVIGGETTNHCYSSVECYNPKTNSWTLLPDMHSARSGAGSGVMDGKLYVVGGQDRFTTHYSSVECYNPVDDTWTPCAEINYARSGVAVAVLGKYLYAIGGRNRGEQTYCNKVERYCPAEDRWEIISPLLHSRAWPAAATFCRCIYVAGGYDGQNRLNTLEQYNPDADKWTNMAEMKENCAGCGLAVA